MDEDEAATLFDVSLALEAAEDAEFAEREFAAELLRKAGGKKRLQVNRYHYKQRWVSRRGFVNLRELAGFINIKYVAKLEQQQQELEKSREEEEVLAAAEEEEFFALRLAPKKANKPDSRVLPKSELLLKSGGECVDPRMLVVSYPGKSRMELFEILGEMEFECGKDGADIHVMNEGKAQSEYEIAALPQDWIEAFEGLPTWEAMIIHLQGIREIDGSYLYADGLSAPKWFVEQWGRAAWNAAKKSKITGSGVVLFHSWVGYTWSIWCQLEFLFCKCLVQKFPKSVYVIDNSLFSPKKKGISRGYFMKGTESYY